MLLFCRTGLPCSHGFSSEAPTAGTSSPDQVPPARSIHPCRLNHRLHRSPPPDGVVSPPQLRQALGVIQVAPIKDQLVAQGGAEFAVAIRVVAGIGAVAVAEEGAEAVGAVLGRNASAEGQGVLEGF